MSSISKSRNIYLNQFYGGEFNLVAVRINEPSKVTPFRAVYIADPSVTSSVLRQRVKTEIYHKI